MRQFRLLCLGVLMSGLLVACVGPGAGNLGSAGKSEAIMGPYRVTWMKGPELTRQQDGLTPLMFMFAWASPAAGSGVTEADWQNEATRQGVDVFTLRTIMGPEVYKSGAGRLAICTIGAIDAGLCGRQLNLSVAQRAAMAQQALGASQSCRWVGFDPAYHAMVANAAGTASHMLHVRADC